nr:matrix glycoprotein M2-2 [Avian metapneumovirus]
MLVQKGKMPIVIPCKRVTAVIRCNTLGVCLFKRTYEHNIINLGDLIEEVARMIIIDHINRKQCNECRKDFLNL